ncbi:ABC transporter permease [Metaclostridioides mangenotii]|uniref:ABC transporter permease n=1 Tax=Metaclostridioides mangenotii TaxID=1540 RepID=UPI0026EB4568|nr:ABC transporter permease [Clostridioides mangenotii]
MSLKLSISYIRKNKSRFFVLLLGVVFSVILVFGFDIISESQNKAKLDNIKKSYGTYNAIFNNVDEETIDKLSKDKGIKGLEVVKDLGSGTFKNGTKVKLESFNWDYINKFGYELESGRIPQGKNEILIEKQALKEMEYKRELNADLDLDIKKQYKDEQNINQIYIGKQKFKVVGVLKKPRAYYDNPYILRAFVYNIEGSGNIVPKNLETNICQISLSSGINNIDSNLTKTINKNNIGRLDYDENGYLVQAITEYNEAKNSETNKEIKLLVILTSIFLIYNLFNISLAEVIKQIGTLRAVGASKSQVRLLLMIQSGLIFVVGTVIGLLGGILFSYIGSRLSYILDTESAYEVFISNGSIIDTVKISFVTVFVSSLIPIFLSGRISPMEAVRKVDAGKLNQKRRFYHKVIRKLFGLTGEMAYKNVFRNRVKVLVSVFAISISGVLFIFKVQTLTSESREKINIPIMNMKDKTFVLGLGSNNDIDVSAYTKKDIDKISSIESVKKVNYSRSEESFIKIASTNIEEDYKKYNGISDKNNIEIPAQLGSLNNMNEYEKFSIKGKMLSIYDKPSSDGYPNACVLNTYFDVLKDHKQKPVIKNLKVGDIIEIKVLNNIDGSYKYNSYKVRVSAIIDESWLYGGYSFGGGRYPEIIVSNNEMDKITGKDNFNFISITAEKGKEENVYKELSKKIKYKPGTEITSKFDFIKKVEDNNRRLLMASLTICILILFIASINIFCTIRTNFLIRINEFSTQRSVGMSLKQLKKMLIKESLIYAVLSTFIAAIGGSILVYKYISEMNRGYKYAFNIPLIEAYKIPIKEICLFAILSTFVCLLTSYLSTRKISKLNIIEGLNKNE